MEANYWKLQAQLLERSTTNTPRRTLMIRMVPMVVRVMTISYILPFPLTVHATKNVVKILNLKLFQSPLESNLGIPHTELLLHLLEETRGMEPEHLLWILRCTPLLGHPGLPAVRSFQMLDPHLT
jgi:hypothetical protein